MIDTLKKHLNKSNQNLIEQLITIIKDNNIRSMKELEQLENEQFTINNKFLNIKERINFASEIALSSYWDYDGLTLKEINTIGTLKDSLSENISDNQKIYNLIKLFDITSNECLFLTEAYFLITHDKYI